MKIFFSLLLAFPFVLFAQDQQRYKAKYTLNGDTISATTIRVSTFPLSNQRCLSSERTLGNTKIKGSAIIITIELYDSAYTQDRKVANLALNVYSEELKEGTYELLPKQIALSHNEDASIKLLLKCH